MKGRHSDIAIVRRIGRRKSRVKIGLRAVLFFLAIALCVAAVAISVNLGVEDSRPSSSR